MGNILFRYSPAAQRVQIHFCLHRSDQTQGSNWLYLLTFCVQFLSSVKEKNAKAIFRVKVIFYEKCVKDSKLLHFSETITVHVFMVRW